MSWSSAGGGREHALAWKLSKSPRVARVFCAPGNAGTEEFCQNCPVPTTDFEGVAAIALQHRIDLVVVGPSEPLIFGLADVFHSLRIPVFGPSRSQAVIEGSKAFSKAFMSRHGIPTAAYQVFTDLREAKAFVRSQWTPAGLVVKTDGLADVQSVVVAERPEEAFEEIERALGEDRYGPAGRRILIEERLIGPEASLLAFVDGHSFKVLPAAQDHKALFDGNRGPNTEGMGAYAPAPVITPSTLERIERDILAPTVAGLAAEGLGYPGVLFVGLILTPERPRVLEYNCRLGDPEAQVTLPALKTDLLEVIDACLAGRLGNLDLQFDDAYYLCVVGASEGYPARPRAGRKITGLEAARRVPAATIFHAHTRREEEGLVTAGGRVLNVVARGRTIDEAQDQAYRAMQHIAFDGGGPIIRRDVGAQATGRLL